MSPIDPSPDRETYEYVRVEEIRPGDVVDGITITAVRQVRVDGKWGAVSLYREPTNSEAEAFFRENDEDLRATWLSTSVPFWMVRKQVPYQPHHLAH